MFILPKNVTIIEVGPRDGLQNERNIVNTHDKLRFIEKLTEANIQEIEVTSFVSPKWVPQMSDAENLSAKLPKTGRQLVLAPNSKGIERAISAGADAVAVFVGVSDSFNQHNINRSTDEAMKALYPAVQELIASGKFVRACISTAFYCPYEGKIAKEDTIELCRQFVAMGVDELSVADTIGQANPAESYELFSALKEEFPDVLIAAHFHDTRKMAIANIYASLQANIDRFDTSAGGLGGCPFAKGATGNVATEDVVNMLHSLGIHTGISIEKVCEAVDFIAPHVSRPIETGMYTLYKKQKTD